MSLTIMRRIKFCAGHRLLGHGGMCAHLHGHNYVADFIVTGDSQDDVGRVIDFAELKKRCKGWLDEHWDHGFVIWEKDSNAIEVLKQAVPVRYYTLPYNPTSENLAKYLLEVVCPKLLDGTGARAVGVRIWETDESYAEAQLDGYKLIS
jgi:6-pyruvoyltetrahydropterin/6-carboxytetrahydropterin synthase